MQTSITQFFGKVSRNTNCNTNPEINNNEINAVLNTENTNNKKIKKTKSIIDKENIGLDSNIETETPKTYKRLRVQKDSEDKSDNDEQHLEQSPPFKKIKNSKSHNEIQLHEIDDLNDTKSSKGSHLLAKSTPSYKKKPKDNDYIRAAAKSLMESFSTLAHESETGTYEDLLELVGNDVEDDVDNYSHLALAFLKPENIRDKLKRKIDHPDYDSTTLFLPEEFMTSLSPGMKQWWKIKANGLMDTLLFFKVGKFYELYHMDALIAINELGIVHMRGNYAHAGFPETAFSKMADQLVFKGYKIARVEQTETVAAMDERWKNRQGNMKDKIINREICQIITPGTRGFSLRNKSCQEFGHEGEDEMGHIADSGGLLFAVKESTNEHDTRPQMRYNVHIGVAMVNTNTGKFMISQFIDDNLRCRFRTMLSRYPPNEIIYLKGNLSKTTMNIFNSSLAATKKECLTNSKQFYSSEETLRRLLESDYFIETTPSKLSRFGLPAGLTQVINEGDNLGRSASDKYELAVSCIGGLLYYLEKCLIDKYLVSIADFNIYTPTDGCGTVAQTCSDDTPFYQTQANMILDNNTLTNLDILRNGSVGGIEGTLLERLDFCSTAFGRRLLIQWVAAPLCNPQMIIERQEAIKELMDLDSGLSSIRSILRNLPDLEKLVAKIHVLGMSKSVTDHPDSRAVLYEGLTYSRRKIADFVTTLTSFSSIISLQSEFADLLSKNDKQSLLLKSIMLRSCDDKIGEFPNIDEICQFFLKAFDHGKAKKEGKIIPESGVDADYDTTVEVIKSIEAELTSYLEEQRIMMKCSQINFFGSGKNRYQLEIPESKCSRVPNNYIASSQRKNYKRYMTTDIEKFLARMILAEEERDVALKNIMSNIFAKFDEHYILWKEVIDNVAKLDVLMSLAKFSRGLDGGPVTRPEIREVTDGTKPFLVITEGRYPCKAKTQSGEFISNTVKLGTFLSTDEAIADKSVMLLTGPNMGGKSTLMRQTALIIILSQLGCYVPAEGPVILTPVDRLMTRQGANDSLGSGQSTLQVEMNEAASILSYMTKHSFLLIDELGRGTATYDGCALAGSILKKIADHLSPRTIFSTHFHKLLEEKDVIANVQICHMACMVEDDDVSVLDDNVKLQNITFLYKLTEGGCPKSYGFNAARLADIPEQVILRGLNKARLFEEETLILEFKRVLNDKTTAVESLKLWQQKFRRLYNLNFNK